jgi:hypothetical protein
MKTRVFNDNVLWLEYNVGNVSTINDINIFKQIIIVKLI